MVNNISLFVSMHIFNGWVYTSIPTGWVATKSDQSLSRELQCPLRSFPLQSNVCLRKLSLSSRLVA